MASCCPRTIQTNKLPMADLVLIQELFKVVSRQSDHEILEKQLSSYVKKAQELDISNMDNIFAQEHPFLHVVSEFG